jgi:hypothetical protein
MKTVTFFCSFLITFTVLTDFVSAQETTVPDIDARRESVTVLEKHITQRQARLDGLLAEIKTLGAKLESEVDEIVGMVSGIRDSVESQVRVARLKADIVGGLKNSVDTYVRHRDRIHEQLRLDNPSIPRATLESDLKVFLERIETRAAQIIMIAESFTDPRDLPKYERTGSTSWGRWSVQNEKISDAWRQDRKEGRHTASMQEQVIAALRESVEHLEQRNSLMSEKLKGQNITAAERELYAADLDRNGELIESREAQIQSIQSSSVSLDDIEPLKRNAAHETELFVSSLRDDLRKDFFAIFGKYAELNKERAELHGFKENLAARKAWLEAYDAKQAK